MSMRVGRGGLWIGSTALSSGGGGGGGALAMPYNNLLSDFGDSRTVQNGASSGTMSYIPIFTSQRLRRSPTWAPGNGGIGGALAVDTAAWPRPVANPWSAVSFTSNGNGTATMTVASGGGGGDNIGIGQLVTGTGIAANTKITALGTGSGGTGTYIVTPDTGTLSSRQVTFYYVDKKTIAECAADQAAIVVIMLGTNGGGLPSETAAVYQIVNGLTVPGYLYPGYRPNGESTDQPLPLYGGLPKTILLCDEMRRGIDWQGLPASGTDGTNLNTHAANLRKLNFSSGDPLQSQHCYVAHVWDSPEIADLGSATSGNPSFLPQAGMLVGGLHFTGVSSFLVGKILGQGNTADGVTMPGFESLISATFPSTAILADTTNYTGNTFINSNPLFTSQTGASVTNFTGAGGTVDSGGLGSGWRFDGSNCSNIHVAFTYTLLPGNDGYELCIHIYSTSTPTANGSITLTGLNASSAKRSLIQSTDKVKFAYRERRQINSGYFYTIQGSVAYPDASHGSSTMPRGGLYSGTDTTTKMMVNNAQASGNANAVANFSDYLIFQADLDLTGTANPTTCSCSWQAQWYSGADIDAYFYLSRMSISRS